MTKPTQADSKCALDISFRCVERIFKNGEEYVTFNHEKASQLITAHREEAVEAERQRMCDVAYEVYNESDMPEEWMDGAYAVIEAIGKEVK